MVKNLGRVVGKSAYEVAVENGFVGTQAQWLASLRGEQGLRGEKGEQGIPGEKGDRGDPAPADSVQQAVNNYLTEHPVEGMTEIEDGSILYKMISNAEKQALDSTEIPEEPTESAYVNLFDKDTMIVEDYCFGTSNTITKIAGSKYAKIPVQPNTVYAMSIDKNKGHACANWCAAYDADFNKISEVYNKGSGNPYPDTTGTGGKITTPENTAYVVVNLYINYDNYSSIDKTDTFMFELGDTCHDYVPFVKNTPDEPEPPEDLSGFEITKLFGMGIADLSARQKLEKFAGLIGNTKPFSGLKWAVIGDSITEKNGRATKNYFEYIADNTGITPVNLGKSGTGYASNYGSNVRIPDRLNDIPSDVDLITVFAGTNDFACGVGTIDDDTNGTTMYAYVKRTIENIIEMFPSVPLGIITPIRRFDDGNAPRMLPDRVEVIKDVCRFYNVPCLDLWSGCGIFACNDAAKAAFIPDGLHPNAEGHKRIAKFIEPWLKSLV